VARVSSIKEYSYTGGLGNQLSISYAYNVTTFTDARFYKQNLTFNDFGQAISISDFGTGSTEDMNNVYGKNYEYGQSAGAKNKLTLDGKLTKAVNNLIYNGSAEYDGKWSLAHWGSSWGSGSLFAGTAYYGSRSLRIISMYDTNIQTVYLNTAVVTKGKTYTLSARALPVLTTCSQGAVLVVTYTDSTGGSVKLTSTQKITAASNNTWDKISFTFDYPANATSDLSVGVGILDAKGTVYFDCVQLEEGNIANSYNLVENGGFNNSMNSWTRSTNDLFSGVIAENGNNVYKLLSNEGKSLDLHQSINQTGNKRRYI